MKTKYPSTKTKQSVSIIIPVYNEEDFIGPCIKTLKSLTFKDHNFEIIVVDNGSTDESFNIAKSYEGVSVYSLPIGNVGAVRNFGAKKGKGDLIAFLDADCLITEKWVHKVCEIASECGNKIYGGGCLLPENASWVETNWLLGDNRSRLPKDLIGASIVIRKDVFNEIGGFNEWVTSGEDTLLNNKLKDLGYEVSIIEELSVIHLGNAKKLSEFFRRQCWHSENYIPQIKSSLKDPTFWLTTFFIIDAIYITIFPLLPSHQIIISLTILFIIPGIFTVKRIHRANPKNIDIKNIVRIYTLDLTYVLGRSFGLLKGLRNIIISSTIMNGRK